MTRRTVVSAVFLGLLAALMVTGPAHASVKPALRIPPGATWHTCTARASIEEGPYLLGDDLFAGRSGRLCIRATTTGTTATIQVLSSVRAQPGGVVAAPYVRYGTWYGAGDPAAFLPQPASSASVVDHVKVTGRARGEWLADDDSYYYPTEMDALLRAPSYELVIASRWHDWPGCGSGCRRVRVGWREFLTTAWMTCPGTIPCHLLMLFQPVEQVTSMAEHLTAFTSVVRRLGWLPAGEWLGNTALQAELWSGGKGLRLSLRVMTTAPVIHPLT
jgi:hypothetical protein